MTNVGVLVVVWALDCSMGKERTAVYWHDACILLCLTEIKPYVLLSFSITYPYLEKLRSRACACKSFVIVKALIPLYPLHWEMNDERELLSELKEYFISAGTRPTAWRSGGESKSQDRPHFFLCS